jgi:hypothetical protein
VRHIDAAKTTKDIGRYAPWDAIEFLKPILGTKKTIIISSNHYEERALSLSLSFIARKKSKPLSRADEERPLFASLGATKMIFRKGFVRLSLSLSRI